MHIKIQTFLTVHTAISGYSQIWTKRSSHTNSDLSFKHPTMKTQWDLPFCKLICSMVCILKVESFWWVVGWEMAYMQNTKVVCIRPKQQKPFHSLPKIFSLQYLLLYFYIFCHKIQGIYYELNLARQRVGVTSDLNPIILSRIIRTGVHLVGWI